MGIDTEARLMIAIPVQDLTIDLEETEYEDGWDWFNEVMDPNGFTHTSPWFDCGFEEGCIGITINPNQSLLDMCTDITNAIAKLKQYTDAEPKFNAYVDVW